MQRFLSVSVARYQVGNETFDAAAAIVPECVKFNKLITAWLPDDSPRLAQLLATLQANGCREWRRTDGSGREQHTYIVSPRYEYDGDDLDRADLFWIIPSAYFHADYYRTHPDGLHARAEGWGDQPGLVAGIYKVFVSSELRDEFERAGLLHAVYLPITLVRYDGSYETDEVVPWAAVGRRPYFELWSDFTLPPLSPRCRVEDEQGNRITDGDWSRGAALLEGEFPASELHYLRRDIEAAGPFDFALTHEHFGSGGTRYTRKPKLVLSRRTYDLLRRLGEQFVAFPGYIDDE